MNVQVRVCERGALKNGRFAFTDKFTLVTELLQNARRANASEVGVGQIPHDRIKLILRHAALGRDQVAAVEGQHTAGDVIGVSISGPSF